MWTVNPGRWGPHSALPISGGAVTVPDYPRPRRPAPRGARSCTPAHSTGRPGTSTRWGPQSRSGVLARLGLGLWPWHLRGICLHSKAFLFRESKLLIPRALYL